MTTDDDLRRLLPAPRRRPGLVAVLVRWRAELALAALLVAGWLAAGSTVAGIVLVILGIVVVVVPVVRRAVVALGQVLVVPHRVRSGLVQAGVTDRSGRPPWLVSARVRGDGVLVRVWLRAGTTQQDLRAAAPVIAGACGAAYVEVVTDSPRQDRAVLVVVRPRWGWWTR
ncbi:hypothetical protein GCM10009609_40300 [Pseudonocardia aurantiaca]|uniref:Uncharacterized protein n=1 Tax=Pseudonocardia aurantiaca TaxID=75290 RepID=A0ABW4FNH8_9PSEU